MTLRTFAFIGICSAGILPIAAAEKSSGASLAAGPVVVEVDGAKLTAADVERKKSGSLFQARNAFYQAQRKAVEEFVDDYILERQAEREHLTVAQLIEKHVTSTLPKDPSEESLRIYFEGVQTTETFEAVRPQIVEHIRQARLDKAKAAYMNGLKSETKVALRLAAPRVPVSLKDTPLRGRPDAKVTIVEYADFECPACQQSQPGLDKLEAEYKGKVAFAYKDVPLPMHSHAQKAAEASHCAGAQGKYWEYHDKLFASRQLDVAQLKDHARSLNLDGKAFDKCLDSGEQADLVKAQLAEGQGYQIQGTPSFFINGRFFSGGMTYEQLRVIVDEELGPQGTQTAQR